MAALNAINALVESFSKDDDDEKEMEPGSDICPLGKTAMILAAARHIETTRELKDDNDKRWYCDPYAIHFAGDQGLKYLKLVAKQTNRDLKFYCWAFNQRTRWFDQKLLNILSKISMKNNDDNLIQIVQLGIGCCTRLYRLEELKAYNISSFEIDLIDIIKYRNKILNEKCNAKIYTKKHKSLAIDLRGTKNDENKWFKQLIENGFDVNKSSIFMFEGLLMYLDKNELNDLINNIKDLQKNCSNGWILGDCVNNCHPALQKIGEKAYKSIGNNLSARSGIDLPTEYFKQFDYKIYCCCLGFGENDYGVTPKSWKDKLDGIPKENDTVPRSFLFYGQSQ